MTQYSSQANAKLDVGSAQHKRPVTRMGPPAKDWRRFIAALERWETRLAS